MKKYMPYLILAAAVVIATRLKPTRTEQAPVINPYLGLIAFPGMVLFRHQTEGRGSETEFASPASLEALYEHMHVQLMERGWRRTDVEWEPEEIEAHYARGAEQLELEVEREDDHFKLEIEFDD